MHGETLNADRRGRACPPATRHMAKWRAISDATKHLDTPATPTAPPPTGCPCAPCQFIRSAGEAGHLTEPHPAVTEHGVVHTGRQPDRTNHHGTLTGALT